MNEIRKALGQRIKQFRKMAHFTQEELAEKINMDSKNLSRIETGNSYPTAGNLESISKILNVEIWQLFHYSDSLKIEDMEKYILEALKKSDKNIVNIYQYLVTQKN